MKRGNGDGSIVKLAGKRRKPFAVRITTGWTDEGKQIYQYLGYYEKKTEAKDALRNYLVKPYDASTKKITLKQIFDDWKKESALAEKTMKNYVSAFNKAKAIHSLPIRDIKVPHLKNIIKDLSPHMQKVFRNAMGQLYTYAMSHEYVDKNIVDLITIKETESAERIPFTSEEIAKLKQFDHPMNYTAIVLLYTGMRITELLILETKNINLAERYMIGGIKTSSGKKRIIPIHDEIFPLIEAAYNPDNKYLLGKREIPYRSYRAKYWDKMMEATGLNHTPHDTRHTFATFADRANMNKVALKRILGHSLKDVTEHYTHKDVDELLTEINKLKY